MSWYLIQFITTLFYSSLLFIHVMYNSLYLMILNSQQGIHFLVIYFNKYSVGKYLKKIHNEPKLCIMSLYLIQLISTIYYCSLLFGHVMYNSFYLVILDAQLGIHFLVIYCSKSYVGKSLKKYLNNPNFVSCPCI